MCFVYPQNVPKLTAAGTSPHTPLQQLTGFPRPLTGFMGNAPREKKQAKGRRKERKGRMVREKRGGREGWGTFSKARGSVDAPGYDMLFNTGRKCSTYCNEALNHQSTRLL